MTHSYTIQQFLNIKTASGPSWSPDGREIAFLSNITGTTQVWTVPSEGGWPKQITFFDDRVMDVKYAPNDGHLLVHKDVGGNERSQLYVISDEGAKITPVSPCEEAIHIGVWSVDGDQIAFSSNRRNPAYFDLYQASASGQGEAEMLLRHDGTNWVQAFSRDGRYLLFRRHPVSMANGLHMLDLSDRSVRALTPDDDGARYLSAQWSADGKGLFVLTDRDRDYLSLAFLKLEDTSLTWLYTPDWDVEEASLSPDGRSLAITVNVGGRSELYLHDVASGSQSRIDVPQGVIGGLDWAPESNALAFSLDGADRPCDVWVYQRFTNELKQLTDAPKGGIPGAALASCEEVKYKSFDDLEIPGWLYLPHGAKKGDDLPVIVWVHGGPESQSRASFNGVLQYFVNRGYAVYLPNVRGSTGYGKAYSHLDDVRRRMDSVADLAACVPFLESTGYIDPGKIVVMGGSYGGFMTLAAITHYPDLWAAAVNIVGIANFETFLENTGAYRRKLRESEYGTLENDRDFFREISPIWHVDKIKVPLFVIHGANDPRVPVGEARQIVEAVRSNGGIVEYLEFPDEGHGLVKLENRMKAYPKIADFLDRYVLK